MKALSFSTIVFLCIGCQQIVEREDIRPNIVAAVKKYYGSLDTGSVFKIDSVIVLKVDTLTPKSDANFKSETLLNRFGQMKIHSNYLESLFILAAQKATLHASLFGKSEPITQMSKGDADQAREDMNKNRDDMQKILNQADSLNKLVLANQIDSVTFLGYIPLMKVTAVNNASGVFSVDSIRIRLDKGFHILQYLDLKN